MTRGARIYAMVLVAMFLCASTALAAWGYKEYNGRDGCYYVCVGIDPIGWVCIRGDCHDDLAIK